MSAAVTFDFHNTLVRCDRWFELEVRTLPMVVHQKLADGRHVAGASGLTECYRALRAEIIEHGREMDAADGVRETFRRAGLPIDPTEIEAIIDAAMTEALDEAELLPGVEATVRYLKSREVRLGIVSSAVHHRFLEWALARFGVADAFEVIITSARAGYYKSRREIYDLALDALGAVAEHSVHVGDSYRFDHLASKGVGFATVWLRDPSDVEKQAGPAPDLELTTLEGAGPALWQLLECRKANSHAD